MCSYNIHTHAAYIPAITDMEPLLRCEMLYACRVVASGHSPKVVDDTIEFIADASTNGLSCETQYSSERQTSKSRYNNASIFWVTCNGWEASPLLDLPTDRQE
jgi:hypothetical protein